MRLQGPPCRHASHPDADGTLPVSASRRHPPRREAECLNVPTAGWRGGQRPPYHGIVDEQFASEFEAPISRRIPGAAAATMLAGDRSGLPPSPTRQERTPAPCGPAETVEKRGAGGYGSALRNLARLIAIN